MRVPIKKHIQRPDGMTMCGLNSLSVEVVSVWYMDREETCKTCLRRLDQLAEIEKKRASQ